MAPPLALSFIASKGCLWMMGSTHAAGWGHPLRPHLGQLGMPRCPPRPAPQLLPTSPLSFLFPIIFLEIVLLADPLPGQLALLPLSRARGGCDPGAPEGRGFSESQCEGHWGRRGCPVALLPGPAPEALWVSCGFLPTPPSQAESIFNCTRPPCTGPKMLSLVT